MAECVNRRKHIVSVRTGEVVCYSTGGNNRKYKKKHVTFGTTD